MGTQAGQPKRVCNHEAGWRLVTANTTTWSSSQALSGYLADAGVRPDMVTLQETRRRTADANDSAAAETGTQGLRLSFGAALSTGPGPLQNSRGTASGSRAHVSSSPVPMTAYNGGPKASSKLALKDLNGELFSGPPPMLQTQRGLPISLLVNEVTAAEHNQSRSGAAQQPQWRSLLAVSDEKPSGIVWDLRSGAAFYRRGQKSPSSPTLNLGATHWPARAWCAEGKRRNFGIIWWCAPGVAARCAAPASAGGMCAAHPSGAAGHQRRAHGSAAAGE